MLEIGVEVIGNKIQAMGGKSLQKDLTERKNWH